MGQNSSIEWTEDTWNPLAGCKEISPGCTNCYAAKMAKRLEAMGQKKYKGTTRTLANGKVVWTNKINLSQADLQIPLKRKKPTIYFVNSMSDLFHEDVPDEFIDAVFAVMALSGQHTFQVLTKRSERMRDYMLARAESMAPWETAARKLGRTLVSAGVSLCPVPPSNVWLGVSVEDQQRAEERIPHLLATPAFVRFLSCEPLLGSLNLQPWLNSFHCEGCGKIANEACHREDCCRAPKISHDLNWVIVGGESGNESRPMHPYWARSIRDQCVAACLPFFFKQHGEFLASDEADLCGDDVLGKGKQGKMNHWWMARDGQVWKEHEAYPKSDERERRGIELLVRVGKHAAGRTLDGMIWDQMPTFMGTRIHA